MNRLPSNKCSVQGLIPNTLRGVNHYKFSSRICPIFFSIIIHIVSIYVKVEERHDKQISKGAENKSR